MKDYSLVSDSELAQDLLDTIQECKRLKQELGTRGYRVNFLGAENEIPSVNEIYKNVPLLGRNREVIY